MEERLKKIEELIADHEKRIRALENPVSIKTAQAIGSGQERVAVIFDDTGRPSFNVLLPHSSRVEIQQTAILLLMQSKRSSEPEMTSKNISSLLHKAGVDVTGIKNAFGYLRQEKPALITSKPGKRTVILTSHGEEKAIKLAKELQWK